MRRASVFVLALGLAACATSDEPKLAREETQLTEVRARVAAVDPESRAVAARASV